MRNTLQKSGTDQETDSYRDSGPDAAKARKKKKQALAKVLLQQKLTLNNNQLSTEENEEGTNDSIEDTN